MELSNLSPYANILSTLDASWNRVQSSGSMHVVLLEGESGMHKTQIVRDFLDSSNAIFIYGRTSQVPESYLPLQLAYEAIPELDIFKKQLEKPYDEISTEWHAVLTTIAKAIPILRPNPVWKTLDRWQSIIQIGLTGVDAGGTSEAGQSWQLNFPSYFALTISELTRLFPLVLFVDDLDLADISTLQALTDNILPSLQNSPLLLIITFKIIDNETETGRTLSKLIERIKFFSRFHHLQIGQLRVDDIKNLVKNQFPETSLDTLEALAYQLCNATSGNLARIQDLLTWIAQQENRAILNSPEVIPDHNHLIQTQFVQMAELERLILQIASVQGMYFCLPVVAKALKKSYAEVKNSVAEMENSLAGWIRFDTMVNLGNVIQLPWYRFRGETRRNLVYQSLLKDQHLEYHQKIASALESIYGEYTANIAGLLSWHYEQGKIEDKAAYYHAIAARQANEQGNFVQGLQYAQKGLSNLKKLKTLPDTQNIKCQLLIEQGRGLQVTEYSYQALDILREAYQLAQDLQSLSLQMETSYHLGRFLLDYNRWDEGIEILSRALILAVKQQSWSIIIEVMEKLRDRYNKRGQAEAYFVLCNEMITIIGGIEIDQAMVTIAEILEDKGWVYYERRENDKALSTFQMAFDYLERLKHLEGFPEIHYKLHRWLASTYRIMNNFSLSLQEADKAIKWSDISHIRRNQARSRDTKAITLRHLGRINEAEEEFKTAIQLLTQSSDLSILGEIEEDYGQFLSDTGHKRQARDIYQQAYEHYSIASNLYRVQIAVNNRANMDKHLGLFHSALTAFQNMFNEGLIQDDKSRQSISLNHIGDIYRVLNRLTEAKQAHSQAIVLCEDIHNMSRKAISLRFLGRLYLVNWDIEHAAAALTKSDELYQTKADYQTRRHHTSIFLGRLLLCKNNSLEAFVTLQEAIDGLTYIQNLEWIGIGNLSLGLVYLVTKDGEKAYQTSKHALEIFRTTESWRISEAHHLLARCYLAMGELNHAQAEIEQAKLQFAKLNLFHRVNQVDRTNLLIEEAGDTSNFNRWQALDQDELRFDFNHLGI